MIPFCPFSFLLFHLISLRSISYPSFSIQLKIANVSFLSNHFVQMPSTHFIIPFFNYLPSSDLSVLHIKGLFVLPVIDISPLLFRVFPIYTLLTFASIGGNFLPSRNLYLSIWLHVHSEIHLSFLLLAVTILPFKFSSLTILLHFDMCVRLCELATTFF